MKCSVASLLLLRSGVVVAREVPRVKDGMVRVVVVVVVVRLVTRAPTGNGGDRMVVVLPRPIGLQIRGDLSKMLSCLLCEISVE